MSIQLLDPRKTHTVLLPSFPGAKVTLYDGLKTKEIGIISLIGDDYNRGLETLRFLIKSWSFVDENKEPLPITKETLGELPVKDFTILMNKITEMLDTIEIKKKKNYKR